MRITPDRTKRHQRLRIRDTLSLLGELTPFFRLYWRRGVLAGLLLIFAALLNLPMPLLTAYIIDKVIATNNGPVLNLIAVVLVALSGIFLISSLTRDYLLFTLRKRIINDVQLKILAHIQQLSLPYTQSAGTGYLMSRMRDDSASLSGVFLETALSLVQNILIFLTGGIVIFTLHWKLALVAIGILPFFLLASTAFTGRVRKAARQTKERTAQVMKLLQETLSGMLTIKSLNRERQEIDRFQQALGAEYNSEVNAFLLGSKASALRGFVAALGPLVVIWYGGHEVIAGRLTIGKLVAFSALLGYLFGPMRSLVGIQMSIQTSLVALERILQILHTRVQIQEVTQPVELKCPQGRIDFEGVRFEYSDNRLILDRVTFHIAPKTTVAIVGPVGTGKTTLAYLLLRLYEPASGLIAIDGVDIKLLGLTSLRDIVGYLPQEPFLFSASVIDNIRYGKPEATMEEVIEAARAANAYSFISALPDQFDTIVDERGANFSGGQRQMIALARLILRDPPILILDEPTAAIDSNAERLIQEALSSLAQNRTTIIISHRLSTIYDADLILVLHHGRIIGKGTHAELIAESDIYREIYNQQVERVLSEVKTSVQSTCQ